MNTSRSKTQHGLFVGLVGFVAVLYVDCVEAAGFQITPTVVGTSRILAGNGVSGEELGDMFYNAAGLALYPQGSCEVGVIVLSPENEFENEGSFRSLGGTKIPSTGIDNRSKDDGEIPSLFCNLNHSGKYYFGLGVTAPFGLATTYGKNWIGRYHAVESELKTIDGNLAVAVKFNNWSVGGGISFQYADVTLSQAVFRGPGVSDGLAEITGDDTSPGFNLGAMYASDDGKTRAGLSFRSKVKHTFTGTRTVSGTGVADGQVGATASVDLPEFVLLSAYKKLGKSKWGVGAGARWTNWSRFKETRIEFDDGSPDAATPQNWDDSWTLGVAIDYSFTDWNLKAALGYDESPIPDEFRNPRIPGTDRTILGLGATWKPSSAKDWSFEFAYHLTMADSRSMNTTTAIAPGVTDTLVGEYSDQNTNVFGIQARWVWGKKSGNN